LDAERVAPHARDGLRDEALLLVSVDEESYAREVHAAGVARLGQKRARSLDVVLQTPSAVANVSRVRLTFASRIRFSILTNRFSSLRDGVRLFVSGAFYVAQRHGQKSFRGLCRAAERVCAQPLCVERAGERLAHAPVVEGRARGVEAVVVERGESV